ncbi:hypothetical protein BDV29DRAFT_153942 [Aspergillus leporis]|uniref:Uncharacterized protein n=1 Tax=Aspergillus leporis TaxID=41062 RepID=A0A5N5XAS3_9EURO|nr:hypothetical protein BDV29DRAFT_153942 [Aspergillus leporis]
MFLKNPFHKENSETNPVPKYERLDRRGSTEYDSLGDHGENGHDIENYHEHTKHRKQYRTVCLRIKDILFILLAAFGLIELGHRAYTFLKTRKPISCNCGDTIEEAIANNCKYDSFAAAWLPPACRNDDLLQQFEQAGPNADGSWQYFADKNKTQVLSLEQVSMLPKTGSHFFTTHQWHLVHCAYYWKKMFLAAETGITIEARYNNLAHITHCEMMFLKRDPLDTIVTEAGVALHSDTMVVAKKHGHDHQENHENHGNHEMGQGGDY